MKMIQETIWLQIVMCRAASIVSRLNRNYGFNIENDLDSIRFVIFMIMSSNNSNEYIIKEFIEMHSFNKKELSSKKS